MSAISFVQSRSRFLFAPLALACVSLFAFVPAQAQTVILVDLNENAGSGGPGGTWNTFATPQNITGGVLKDAANLFTPITLSVSGIITDNTANGGLVVFNPNQAGFEGLPSWATSTTNNAASGDNFFTSNSIANSAQAYTLTFGGLTPGNTVSFDLLAARDSASALGFFDFSLDGGLSWEGFRVLNGDGSLALTNGWDTQTTALDGGQAFSLQTQGFSLHRYMNISDVTLTGDTFSVRTTDGNTTQSTFSAMNAMRLTVVPEPGSAVLLLGAALGLCGFSRRRHA